MIDVTCLSVNTCFWTSSRLRQGDPGCCRLSSNVTTKANNKWEEEEDVVESKVIEIQDQRDDDGVDDESLLQDASDDERSEEEANMDDLLESDGFTETIQVCDDVKAFFKDRMKQFNMSKEGRLINRNCTVFNRTIVNEMRVRDDESVSCNGH